MLAVISTMAIGSRVDLHVMNDLSYEEVNNAVGPLSFTELEALDTNPGFIWLHNDKAIVREPTKCG